MLLSGQSGVTTPGNNVSYLASNSPQPLGDLIWASHPSLQTTTAEHMQQSFAFLQAIVFFVMQLAFSRPEAMPLEI